MTPERWERIQDLYHASRARPDRERAQFLADVCAGDDALRREVQALLDQPVATSSFVDFIGGPAPRPRASDSSPLTGQRLGSYQMSSLIGRGGMLRDQNSLLRRAFTGLKWFAPNDAFKVVARFERYASPSAVKVPNILGDLDPFDATGLLAFALGGKTYKLEVYDLGAGSEPLFIVFKDLTSGHETYPAARFLNAARPNATGETVLDFNKAYNPPCAYNPFTTCPLPTAQNRLNVRIEAGELDYHRQH